MQHETINFEIQATEDYCGGAAPPEELINELRTPKPYTGKIYVHNTSDRTDEGVSLDVLEGKASASGFVEGTYHLFLYKKYVPTSSGSNKESISPFNTPECQKDKSLKSLGSFEVARDTKTISKQIHVMCDPCMEPRP